MLLLHSEQISQDPLGSQGFSEGQSYHEMAIFDLELFEDA